MSDRKKPNAATIADVARLSGVSAMTVSRVVNRVANVKTATREKVETAIAELGYAPNVAARNLAGARAKRICLLYGNPSSAYLGELMLGALEAASEHGARLIVERTTQDLNPETLEPHFNRDWDAIIIPPPMSDIAGIRKLVAKHDFPAVFMSSARKEGRANEIRIDDFKAAYEMTEHLISQGHKRIGFIKGNPNQSVSLKRYEGYCAALLEAGIPRDDAMITEGLFTYKSGEEAASKLLEQSLPPTAIFASNDDMATGALASAARYGLSVPDALAIVGFDDSPIATIVWPPLTTLRQPVSDMAKTAIEMLMSPRTPDTAYQTIILPHKLITRGTG